MPTRAEHIPTDELVQFLGGETGDGRRRDTIERHLAACRHCQALAAQLPANALELKLRELHQSAEPGFRLSDRYELREEVGRGAAGVVYRARQPGLGRDVAVKMIISGASAGPGEIRRFRREAEVLAKVEHPNVVRIFESGDQDGLPFIAMELVPGRTLDFWLQRQVLAPRTAAELVRQLADAMRCVHQQGILHRDLKPQNVLLADHRTGLAALRPPQWSDFEPVSGPLVIPKITDFGLSALVDGTLHTRTGLALGTPSYMPPELARGDGSGAGPATDVYGLGGILYESLTGRPPFVGETTAAVLRSVIEDEILAVRKLRPDVPRDLATICEKCLDPIAHRRYETADALHEELQKFVAGQPIQARPAGSPERAVRWMARNPWQAAAAGLAGVLLLVAIGIGGAWQLFTRQQRDLAVRNYQSTRETLWQVLNLSKDESVFRVPQLTRLVLEQTKNALPLFEKLAVEEQTASARLDLMQIRLLLGSLLAGTGELDEARAFFESVSTSLRDLDDHDPDLARLGLLLESQVKQAVVLCEQKKYSEAISILQNALGLAEHRMQQLPNDLPVRESRAWTLHNLANAYVGMNRYDEAIAHYSTAIADRQGILEANRRQGLPLPETGLLRRLTESRMSRAVCEMSLGNSTLAAAGFRDAIASLNQILEQHADDVPSLLTLASCWLNLSNVSAGQGNPQQAIADCQQGIAIATRVCQADPDNFVAANYLSMLYGNCAMFQMQDRLLDLSLQNWDRAREIAVDAETSDYCQAMKIRNLLELGRFGEAEHELTHSNLDTWSGENRFVMASNWALLIQEANPLSTATGSPGRLKQVSSIMADLQQAGFLQGNQDARQHVLESEDFAAVRSRLDDDEIAAWFR